MKIFSSCWQRFILLYNVRGFFIFDVYNIRIPQRTFKREQIGGNIPEWTW